MTDDLRGRGLVAHQPAAATLRAAAFRVLLNGGGPTVAGLAEQIGMDEHRARAVVAELAASGLLTADGDRITGAMGLSAGPTQHRLETAGRVLSTWCAYDAVGIPAALGLDAVADTACPACGTEIRVVLHSGVPAQQSQVVGWWPDDSSCSNVVEQFCPLANLFCCPAHLDQWRAAQQDPAGTPMDLRQLAEAGRVTWGGVSGSA